MTVRSVRLYPDPVLKQTARPVGTIDDDARALARDLIDTMRSHERCVGLAANQIGVLRRWRWTFWLVLFAFLFGVLRVPASILQFIGLLPASGPVWYESLQGAIGMVQFLIALAMLVGYRKSGPWGDV